MNDSSSTCIRNRSSNRVGAVAVVVVVAGAVAVAVAVGAKAAAANVLAEFGNNWALRPLFTVFHGLGRLRNTKHQAFRAVPSA